MKNYLDQNIELIKENVNVTEEVIIPKRLQLYTISDNIIVITSIIFIDDKGIVYIPKKFRPEIERFYINQLGVYNLANDDDYTLEEFLNK